MAEDAPRIRHVTRKGGEVVVEETPKEQGSGPMKIEHTTMRGGKLVKVDEKGREIPLVEVDPLGLRPDRSKDRI